MRIIFVLLAISSVSTAAFYGPVAYKRTPLGDSIDVSTMKVLKEAYEASADKNIVSSPLGLMMLLSLYNLGTGPAGNSEITKFLGGKDFKQTAESFKQLSVTFSEMDRDYLTVANKITVSDKYTLDEKFAAAARDHRSEFDKLDFTKPEEAAAKINQWSAEKTKGYITSPVSKDALSPDTAAALFNVIFFKGHWRHTFRAEETKEKDFHVSHDTVVKKPMMHLFEALHYTESQELDAKMIELPYLEKGFRMVVVLPNKIDGLSSLLEKTTVKGLLSDVYNLRQIGSEVDLEMPKFDIRTKLDFNDILPKVGVSTLFNEPATGVVRNVPVKISKAFQEATIEVTEEGATASAFSGVIAVPTSALIMQQPPIKITVDHPFLYAILYNNIIVFAGTYSK